MLPSFTSRKILLFCGIFASTAAPALAQRSQASTVPKLAPDLSRFGYNSASSTNVSVIVQYVSGPASADLQKLGNLGGTTPIVMKSIKAAQVSLPASALDTLRADPNVRYVSPDRSVGGHAAFNNSASIATSAEYTAEPINAPSVWSKGIYGRGVGVAVIDSGIASTRDLAGRVVFSACFLPNCGNDTYDHYGHGTHVAGLIAGNGTASTGMVYNRTFVGIAPGANIINLKVLDNNGQGTDTAVIQAIETAITLKSVYNIRVINLSLGRPIWESYQIDPLCQAVEQAWQAGIVVVTAAGNAGRNLALNPEGYGTAEAPGNDPYALTVGALRTNGTASNLDDAMASYSSKGPSFIDLVSKPDIVAPGNLVTSLNAGGNTLQQNNPTFYTPTSFYFNFGQNTVSSSDYMPLSGTSMATAVTSGAVALVLNANSALTPDQVKALLMLEANKNLLPQSSSVTDGGITYTAHDDVFTVGAGYLDVAAAVNNVRSVSFPSGSAMSPIATFDANSGNAALVTDSTALWGRSNTFSASGVYGSNAFLSGNTALWGRSATTVDGSTALWGRDDPQAFTALWGSTALWGRATPDAATALWGRSGLDGSTAFWGR